MTAVEVRAGGPAEQRDPRGSTTRVAWSSPSLPQIDEWNAEQAFRLGVAANVIAYRCVQLRANAGSSIPLVAGRRHGDASTIVERAAITKLLGPTGSAAPRLSARKLIRWTLAQEIVTGRRAWEIETGDGKVDGRPTAFWPLASAHLRAYPTASGAEWFRLFEYGLPHDPVKFQPGFVFYGWDPSGTDFRQPESVLQSCRYDLSLVTLADRYGIGFLRNNAVPATIVTTTEMPADHKRRFEQNWQNEYAGPDNAGRVAFNYLGEDGDGPVGDSIDVKQLGLSAKDARLVETRKEAMSEIAIALGVPWSKLDASGRTFDNAEIEDRTFYEETVLPDLADLADDINAQLAPRLGSEVVWFDFRSVRALQRKLFTVGDPAPLLDRGVVSKNEVRSDLELEAIDGGDEPAGQDIATMTPRQQVREVAEMAQKLYLSIGPIFTPEEGRRLLEYALSDGGIPVELMSPELAVQFLETVERKPVEPTVPELEPARAPVVEQRIADPEAVEARRAGIWRASDAVVSALEARWVRTMRRLFSKQQEATLARLTGKRGRQQFGEQRDPAAQVDPSAIFDLTFWRNATVEVVEDLFEEVSVAGLSRLSARFGVAFDVTAPFVREMIEARVLDLAGHVTQTTYEAIRLELADGVLVGDSIDDLAKRIRQVFTVADQTRAVTIARTEVISAYNGAAALGAAQLPADVVGGQEWIATRDGRTRDSHAAADGQIVAVGQPFAVGGSMGAYPGDPSLPAGETINCRCTVAFLTPDEFAEEGGRAPRRVDVRAARAMLGLVNPSTDLLAWRRALEVAAA